MQFFNATKLASFAEVVKLATDSTLTFMFIILIAMAAFIAFLAIIQKRVAVFKEGKSGDQSAAECSDFQLPSWLSWLKPCFEPNMELTTSHSNVKAKAPKSVQAEYSTFVFYYTLFWLSVFSGIVASGIYATFDAWSYLKVCGGLCLPLFAQVHE